MILKLLFVDDQTKSVIDPKENFEAKGHDCRISNFEEASQIIKSFLPDVIILDLLSEGAEPDEKPFGEKIFNDIWNFRFCPIIIYSALPESITDERVNGHNFIKKVTKGSTSIGHLEKALESFTEHITAIKDIEKRLDGAFCIAIRELANQAFMAKYDDNTRKDIIIRCGLRRISALIDSENINGRVFSWEQYIYPPFDHYMKLGDVIRLTAEDKNIAEAFRIVLTPSCDLVFDLEKDPKNKKKRKPKVEHALVAKCFPITKYNSQMRLCKTSDQKNLKDNLIRNILTQGFYQKILIIPSLPGEIPEMAADLKSLEFVPISEVANDNSKRYKIIASVDSPFRELVSWAYMLTSCRPGLPERDFGSWADSIIAKFEDSK